jgi:predicted metal-dependent HD superfamily phosphohydrolase
MDENKFENLLEGMTDLNNYKREWHMKHWWQVFCKRNSLPAEFETGTYFLLQKFYLLPQGQRHYHTLNGHIYSALNSFYEYINETGERLDYREEIEYSIWFHDILLKPGDKSAEAESAGLANLLAYYSDLDRDIIESCIMATKTSLPPINAKGLLKSDRIVADVDLVGLSDWDTFTKNGELIRLEYNFVPDDVFYPKRKEFMNQFLERKYIYHLPYFKEKYEKGAQENITRFVNS